MPGKKEVIHTSIWQEIPARDDPYAAETCYCRGFDVYGDLLRHASWVDYLFLLFKGEPPTPEQHRLLELLAIGLANPGPRDHSVRAAMNAGVAGSTAASTLMAALAVGAGALGGGQDVMHAVERWHRTGKDLEAWLHDIASPDPRPTDIWPDFEHPPGFDPNRDHCSPAALQFLQQLGTVATAACVQWLDANRVRLEAAADAALSVSGIAAAAFADLEFDAPMAEMAYLLLRLPGAAAHGLEQREYGWRRYPFFSGQVTLHQSPPRAVEDHAD